MAITDNLPAYNAAETVNSLFHPNAEVEETKMLMSDIPLRKPYATLDDAPEMDHFRKRSASVPPRDCGPLAIKSIMSSGHPESSRALEDVKRLISIAAAQHREEAILASAAVPAIASGKQVGVTAPALALESAVQPQAAIEEAAGNRTLIRSSSAGKGRKEWYPRGISPGGRMMIANSQHNRAATARWCSGLRNEVSDMPWVSTAQTSKIERVDTLAITARTIKSGPHSLALAAQKPRGAFRREIWQSTSPKQLSDVHHSIKKNCEERIEMFRQELSVLNSRNASIRAHIEHFKREECVPAIADYMSECSSISARVPAIADYMSECSSISAQITPATVGSDEPFVAASLLDAVAAPDTVNDKQQDATRIEAALQAVLLPTTQREADSAPEPPPAEQEADAAPCAPSTASTFSIIPATAAAPTDDEDDVAVPAG